jgi:hypothetical protein
MLTQERLKQLMTYDPLTGIFTRNVKQGKSLPGSIAGHFHKSSGYIKIMIDYKLYRASRLAWLYMTGSWPKLDVDHKDLVRHNNIWENLREATQSQNSCNRNLQRNNTSGAKGIRYREGNKSPWGAHIKHHGKWIPLGWYKTKEEALEVRDLAEQLCQGEFRRK